METRKLSLTEMVIVEGGHRMCNAAAGLVGGIWGAAISMATGGAGVLVGIAVGTAISTGLSRMACN